MALQVAERERMMAALRPLRGEPRFRKVRRLMGL